jgi:hypothetical protein
MLARGTYTRAQMDQHNATARERRRKAREARRVVTEDDRQHERNCNVIIALLLGGASLEEVVR